MNSEQINADNKLEIDASIVCERPRNEWREIFNFSNRARGAHISQYKLNQNPVYIPDFFNKQVIEGINDNAIPENIAVICSPYVFKKIKNLRVRANSIIRYLKNEDEYDDEARSFYNEYLKKHRTIIIEALVENDDEEGLTLLIMFFRGSRINIVEECLAVTDSLDKRSLNAYILNYANQAGFKSQKDRFKL